MKARLLAIYAATAFSASPAERLEVPLASGLHEIEFSDPFFRNFAARGEWKKFQQMSAVFQKYAARYDLDYLLMMALGYQESRLDQNAKSRAGAVGVMQIMPATGKEMNTGDINQLEPNIHAGLKYVRLLLDRYFQRLPMDALNKTLFAVAAYNAGPARIAQLRAEAREQGLDPNVWMQNVETVAAARIGDETVKYVSSLYNYYVNYTLRRISGTRHATPRASSAVGRYAGCRQLRRVNRPGRDGIHRSMNPRFTLVGGKDRDDRLEVASTNGTSELLKGEAAIDEALAESFPASDPPPWTRGLDRDSRMLAGLEDVDSSG
jgi:soluble lytic murein transglycosylase-like protein